MKYMSIIVVFNEMFEWYGVSIFIDYFGLSKFFVVFVIVWNVKRGIKCGLIGYFY